ncbi:hypothetical protein F7725_018508 [Dissostichus mawsoni]|uniref:STX17-like N-terminal domain-containing protein n=1 Tax=Dissostichus mawsoni TaxID=36200 RepID=A0A7J5XSE5_DISMA|nr:hypothetical protein F7725_018508 [Dissostichus mawsoni]
MSWYSDQEHNVLRLLAESAGHMAEEGSKLTLRRLEAPIHKFIKVALPTDLERLQKHHNNILKQLRANMREMEKLCMRVRAEDTPALDALVQPVRDRASAAARDFLLLHSNPVPQPAPKTPPAAQPNRCVSSSYHDDDDVCEEPLSGRQIQLQLPEIPADQSAAESWDNLEEDLKELSGLVMEFSLLVHAVGYKLALLPVAGALLGGVLGGPLGLLVGFKAAGVAAALGGGVLGYAGGNLVQKQRKARVDLQMKRLTAATRTRTHKDK